MKKATHQLCSTEYGADIHVGDVEQGLTPHSWKVRFVVKGTRECFLLEDTMLVYVHQGQFHWTIEAASTKTIDHLEPYEARSWVRGTLRELCVNAVIFYLTDRPHVVTQGIDPATVTMGSLWVHSKTGRTYQVFGVGLDASEAARGQDRRVVMYRPLKNGIIQSTELYCRPLDEFCQTVELHIPRFQRVEEAS